MAHERFVAVLRAQGPLCDDCVFSPAGLARRQGANQLGRQLQGAGLVTRGEGICAGCSKTKVVNRAVEDCVLASVMPAPPAPRGRDSRSWHLTSAQFEQHMHDFVNGGGISNGRQPDERYASFDYCFNYYQSFRDAGEIRSMASPENIQGSCLQLGFYLASWGMLRGSSHLLQRSARFLVPVIELLATTDPAFWGIDVDCYDSLTIRQLLQMGSSIGHAIGSTSDTLVTKVMLGVFGCVPAFDRNFKLGFGVSGFNAKSLGKVADFYADHAQLIDACRIRTVDFLTGQPTGRLYTRAKLIDMAFFVRGMDQGRSSGVHD